MINDLIFGKLHKSFLILTSIMMLSVGAAYSSDSTAKAVKSSGDGNWESTMLDGKKEGKIMIYGQAGPELRVDLTKAFKDELGLVLELVPGKGSEIMSRFTTEMQGGFPSADILLGGATTFLLPELYNYWQKLDTLLTLPEVLDSKAWPNGKLPFVDKQKKMIPLILQANLDMVVNSNMVKPGQIKTYRDLLQPQWKGKIVMYDPTINGSGQTWVRHLLIRAYGMSEGEAFLRKYAAQEPIITRDSRLQIEWVARGRYPVTIGMDSQAAYNMQKSGAPIARVVVEEGGLLTGGGSHIVLPVKRPHPQAAVLVLNWLLSARGQAVFSKAHGGPAARLGIKSDHVNPMAFPIPGEKLYMQDEETFRSTMEPTEVAKRIFGPLLK